MDDQEFHHRCDDALGALYKALAVVADRHDFDVDHNAGTLTIEFEEPRARFVVSPNSPVHQIWVSALTKSFKLSWDAARAEFVLPETGASLQQLLADAVGQHLGVSIEL